MLGPAVAATLLKAFLEPAVAAAASSLEAFPEPAVAVASLLTLRSGGESRAAPLGGLRSGGASRASHSRSSSTPCLGSSCLGVGLG